MPLAPQEKIDYINYIVNFLTNKNDHEIAIYFEFHSINHHSNNSLQVSLFHANDNDIKNLYEYIPKKNINDFFYDKNACLEIFKKEKYQDLKAYLDECFYCLQSNNKLACLVILRICLEMFCNFINSPSNEKELRLNLEKKLEKVIDDIKNKSDYKILNSKINEIEKLFNIYRLQGNHVAHCRVNEAKRFIEDYCLESNLKLFCIILENSIFKEDIIKINEKLKSEKLNSIDFSPQKIDNKINEKTIEKTNNINEDDETPF